MKAAFTFFFALFLFGADPTRLNAQNSSAKSSTRSGLTIDDIVNLLEHGAAPDQVLTLVQTTRTAFDLSPAGLSRLRAAAVLQPILDAMFRAALNAAPPSAPGPPPSPAPAQTPPVTVPSTPLPPNVNPPPAGGQPGSTPVTGSGSQVPSNSEARFNQAKQTVIRTDNFTVVQPNDPGCATVAHRRLHRVDLDWQTGGSTASRLSSSGIYCFALPVNAMYDRSLSGTITEPTGNPFDLINDAIKTLTSLSTGAAAASAKAPTPRPEEKGNPPAGTCAVSLADVSDKSAVLTSKLDAMAPPKDSSGKYLYVPASQTRAAWVDATSSFNAFEESVQALQRSLPNQWNQPASCDDIFAQAESIIIDKFKTVRDQYIALRGRLSQPDVLYYELDLDGTEKVDLNTTISYAGQSIGSQKFHLEPSFGILSSSAGFLLTQLPARSYSSATAPDPSDPTKTQNVLRVDYGMGIRPALVVLLTGNAPQLNRHNWGLGVSGGPVFDVSNGKADTSHFGFFGGLSLRVTPWIYLTPGVHVGEFADFPAGFTHAGQVIPANTGTPTPTKRYTARFAFSITFKLKDLGATPANQSSNTNTQTNKGSGQPAASDQAAK
jgi:hypothetical protein